MSRKGPRGLRPDEKELWGRVTDTAEPLRDLKPLFVERPKTHAAHPKTVPAPPPRFRVGQKAGQPQAAIPAPAAPIAMDRKTYTRMKKGRLTPDARIDLHGMTQDRAHPALVSTILNAHAEGKRLVLVITGKGKSRDDGGPIPVRTGVLKHAVPQWLRQPPLASAILQVTEANQTHGGSGALYVYLRRLK